MAWLALRRAPTPRSVQAFEEAQRLVQQAEEAWHVGLSAVRRTTPASHLECATFFFT